MKDCSPEVRVEFELCLNIGLDVASIQEAFLDTSNDGNHHSYPVSYSSSEKHIEWASCPLTPLQKVKQGFFEDFLLICCVFTFVLLQP